MATTDTNSNATRVRRFRTEFLDQKWPFSDESTAGRVAYSVAIELGADAIANGEFAEAQAWASLGQLALYRFRRSL